MKRLVVYHGTDTLFDEIDINQSKDKRDFGKGFYTTTIASQAESWARSVRIRNHSKEAYVNVYELSIDENVNVCVFEGLTLEWLEFIKVNRSMGNVQHKYDIVIGPVANDNTLVTVNRYIQGIYTAEEAIRRLSFFKANDQVTFHTSRALGCLKFVRRYKVGI